MNGHNAESLACLPVGAKTSLVGMHNRGQIGWRFHAMNTYLILTFLRSLENSFRTMTSGKKHAAIDMPSFDDIFDRRPKKAPPRPSDPFDALEKQLGF